MKTKTSQQNNLYNEGKAQWENTGEYNKKVTEISKELLDKYSPILFAERNWFKRILLRIRFWREKTKKINELSSWKNLHLAMMND